MNSKEQIYNYSTRRAQNISICGPINIKWFFIRDDVYVVLFFKVTYRNENKRIKELQSISKLK